LENKKNCGNLFGEQKKLWKGFISVSLIRAKEREMPAPRKALAKKAEGEVPKAKEFNSPMSLVLMRACRTPVREDCVKKLQVWLSSPCALDAKD